MIILIASNLREIVWLYSLILELRPVYFMHFSLISVGLCVFLKTDRTQESCCRFSSMLFCQQEGGEQVSDRRVWLNKVLGFRILRIYLTDLWILKSQCITNFFNISAWIMDFVCLILLRIAELQNLELNFFIIFFPKNL